MRTQGVLVIRVAATLCAVPFYSRLGYKKSSGEGEITDNLVIEALKNHEHKMCYHGLEGLEICWSYLVKIGENNALVCPGRPCKNEYTEIAGKCGKCDV